MTKVKQPTTPQRGVYFAGKISQSDWRHRLPFQGVSLRGFEQSLDPQEVHRLPVQGGHTYCGPYFFADDHGGGHGCKTHGSRDTSGGGSKSGSDDARGDFVVQKCLTHIRAAAVVFAWIDTLDCFGTLIELGYAHALGKPILVGVDLKLLRSLDYINYDFGQHRSIGGELGRHELWFLQNISQGFKFFPSVGDASLEFLSLWVSP